MIFRIIVSLIIYSLILPFILKSPKNNKSENGSIELTFSSLLKNFMLIGVITFFFVTILFIVIGLLKEEYDNIIGSMFFLLCLLGFAYGYMYIKNKKIIYYNGVFNSYDTFGKETIFYLSEIKEVLLKPQDGILIIFNDNRKLKIDKQLNNYSIILEMLEQNNIEIKDKSGNVAPKGW